MPQYHIDIVTAVCVSVLGELWVDKTTIQTRENGQIWIKEIRYVWVGILYVYKIIHQI